MKEIFVKNRLFRIDVDKNISIDFLSEKGGVAEYKIALKFDKPTAVKDAIIRWYEPMRGILSVWLPTKGRDRSAKQWFYKSHAQSSFCYGAPVLCVCDKEFNFQTFALSDAQNCHDLAFFVDDFTDEDNVCMQLSLFQNETIVKEYSTILRIDSRNIPFNESIASVTEWWKDFYKRQIANTEFAEYPLYSTWYNFHQHPNQELLEKELFIAKDLGFKTVILDDGWQYDGNGTGDYRDCGPWAFSLEKFPDFKSFVDKVHSFGMQIAVWFPVPFVGYDTQEYVKFKDRLLFDSDFLMAGILDPRYPDVRKYIVDLFASFVAKYSLDGLKLDFVDEFKLMPESPACNDLMDCETVEIAVEKLLTEIVSGLKAIKPELLIEFRQAYVGPSIVRFCNMLRVADCAFDSLTNRIAVTDLRLPEYDLAVHSDMLYWSKHESLANVKKQLLNVFFSVPQISVLLSQSSSEQLELIKKHLAYWEENKDIILHGKFNALNVEHNYPIISSENDVKKIVVLHDVYTYSNFNKNVDLINAGSKDVLYLELDKNGSAIVYDMMEHLVQNTTLNNGVNKIIVPVGGRVEVRF